MFSRKLDILEAPEKRFHLERYNLSMVDDRTLIVETNESIRNHKIGALALLEISLLVLTVFACSYNCRK